MFVGIGLKVATRAVCLNRDLPKGKQKWVMETMTLEKNGRMTIITESYAQTKLRRKKENSSAFGFLDQGFGNWETISSEEAQIKLEQWLSLAKMTIEVETHIRKVFHTVAMEESIAIMA